MNEAGRSVGPARGALHVELERVLVIHDEIDLPFGEVRTRLGGGLAGHNGLKSVKAASAAGTSSACAPASGARTPPTRRSSPPTCSAAFARAPPRCRRWSSAPPTRSSGRARGAAGASGRAPDGGTARLAALAAGAPRPRTSRPEARRDGGHAFVSSALRPYLIAALADIDEEARGAAGSSSSATTGPRATCGRTCAPGWRRGACATTPPGGRLRVPPGPPPHLVGLRVAALDALLGRRRRRRTRRERRSSSSAPWRCRRRCPTRRCARTPSRCASASCSTSTSAPRSSSAPATSAPTRSRSAGSSRCAAACSTSFPRPRTAPSGSTCSTSRSNRCAGSPPSPSARSGRRGGGDRAGRRARRRAPRAGRDRRPPGRRRGEASRPDIAELLPVERFGALLDLLGDGHAR